MSCQAHPDATHVQSTRAALTRAPAEATRVPKKPPKAKGTRPTAALLEVAVLVPVVDVLDDVVVVVVWLVGVVVVPVGVVMVVPGAVGVVVAEVPDEVAPVGVVVLAPVDSEPPEVVATPPHSCCARARPVWRSSAVQLACKHWAAAVWKETDEQTQAKSVKPLQPALWAAEVTHWRRQALKEGVEEAALEVSVPCAWTARMEVATRTTRDLGLANMTD